MVVGLSAALLAPSPNPLWVAAPAASPRASVMENDLVPLGDFPTFGEYSTSTIVLSDFFSSGQVGPRFAFSGTCSGSFAAQTGKWFSRLSVE